MEKQYILVPAKEIDAYKERFGNYRKDKTGYFIQDTPDTARIIKLDDGEYYLLSWRQSKPSEVDEKYDATAVNEKDKIYVKDDLINYLEVSEVPKERP